MNTPIEVIIPAEFSMWRDRKRQMGEPCKLDSRIQCVPTWFSPLPIDSKSMCRTCWELEQIGGTMPDKPTKRDLDTIGRLL
jgi:hypothetical protein